MGVRRETVRLTLEDHFSTGMVKAAASVALADKTLERFSKNEVVAAKEAHRLEQRLDRLTDRTGAGEKALDQYSGRLRILAEVGGALGPALAPVGAVAIPAVSGLVSELGFATIAAGTTLVAFQGVGTALEAVNKAALEPTTENLAAARVAMEDLSPAARGIVRDVRDLLPELKALRDTSAAGLFPGLRRGLDGLEQALPRVSNLVEAISTEVGDIAGDAGQSLGSERWAGFLDFVADEGPDALRDLATAAGNTAHALAGLWEATDPLNDDFGNWLVEATADLDRWAAGLDQTEGFENFIAYVEENGPQVAETVGAIGNAIVQIVQASAPLGGPVLRVVESLADALATIADSPAGTALVGLASAMSALSLASRTYGAVVKAGPILRTQQLTRDLTTMNRVGIVAWARTTEGAERYAAASARAGKNLRSLGKGALAVGGLAAATSGLTDKVGLSNAAILGLAGSVAGPWGAAIGAGIGGVMDLAAANDDLVEALNRADVALRTQDVDAMNDSIAALRAQLDDLNQSDNFLEGAGDWFKSFSSGGKDAARASLSARLELIDLNQQLAETRAKSQLAADGLQVTEAGLDSATTSATDFKNSLIEANNVLANRGSAVNYEAALDDFTESLKENGRTLDITTEKGRANRTALDNIAISALDLAEKISDPVLRSKFLDSARSEYVKAAKAAGQSAAAARALATDVQLLNTVKGRPKIDTSSLDAATVASRNLLNLLGRIAGKKVGIQVERGGDLSDILGGNLTAQADGGTVPGPRYPYGDKVLALLAPTEEVITNRNGEADRFRADRAAGRIPAYADGGTVSGRSGRPPGFAQYVRQDLDMKYPTTIRQWNEALKASTKLLGKEKDERQKLLDQADSIRSGIRSNFRTNLFGQEVPSSSVWMSEQDRAAAGTGDVFSTLTGDLDRLGALKGAIRALKSKGLDGAALTELLSQGNLEEIQGLASGNKADVMRYERLFNARERQLAQTGNLGASAATGAELRALASQLQEARRATSYLEKTVAELKKLPRAVGREINNVGPRRR